MPTSKPKTAKPKKEKPPPQPDDIVREAAGAYASGDGRFRVTQSDASWFVTDTQQTNEFGQELIHGPFGSLKQAQASLSGARTVKPLLRSVPRPKQPAKAAPKPPPAPISWIDRLEEAEQKTVRRLIRALEKEGLQDADELVRRHRDDPVPFITSRLLERRLDEIIAAQPTEQQDTAREVVRRAAEVLTIDGLATSRPVPRWALIELDDDAPAPKRAVRLRR